MLPGVAEAREANRPAAGHVERERGHERQAQRYQFYDRINRQLHQLPIDQNPTADDFIKPTGLDGQEHTVDRRKR